MWRQLRWSAPLVLLLAAVGWWIVPRWAPLPAALLTPRTPSISYVARDGRTLRTLLTAAGDRVQPSVPLAEIPKALVYATLAAEDKRFGQHHGLDLLAIGRAARDNLTSGRIVSGASTIHQQLIKVTAQAGRRTLKVKFVEALQARHLAMEWSREVVITEYLHRISYGNLLTGCASAASGYFNKPLDDLTVAECAFLAAIPQSPTKFNPFRDVQAILPRQQRILRKMKELGWITDEELRVALAEPISLQRYTGGFAAPHAVEMLRGEGSPSSNAAIRTTLDWFLQRQVEAIIGARLAALKGRHVTQGAAVVIENATGYVLALAGSRDFFAADGGQINGAWTPHSPGSAIKPFTYALAFERGATPASIAADLPIEFTTPTGTYRPENYAHRLYGPVTYRDALGNSLNVSAVKVLASIGGAQTLLDKLRLLGLSTLTEEADHYGLGLTIGNAPVRLIELANAYACLARLGVDRPWTLKAGVPPAEATRRLGERECFLIADILNDNQARLLTFGANSPLRLPFSVAVKTGTSQSYRDNWTFGYTPDYTVGVWTGNFDNTPMQDVSGVTGAAPIWRDIFLHLHERKPQTWYSPPAGLVRKRIDPRTGKYLTPQTPPVRISREEWFLENRLPPAANAFDYDERGRAVLAAEYVAWIRSSDNWMGDLVATGPTTETQRWRIANPIAGTVIRLDPDIRENGRRLLLETTPEHPVEWRCTTLQVQHEGDVTYVLLSPGRHDFTARDPKTGEEQKSFVIVRPE
ncbi:MAG: transglycosylase domain-containing protein [Prosthecobacter sp.]|nr:transglycosylase domain-containing protein [Prosthecobacter sp.]